MLYMLLIMACPLMTSSLTSHDFMTSYS